MEHGAIAYVKDKNDGMFRYRQYVHFIRLRKWDNLNLSNIKKTSVPCYFSKNALACKS